MKKSIDFALDDHPDGDELPGCAWAVSIVDDCEACADLRVELNVEESGHHGEGLTLHLSRSSAKRLAGALASALKELGSE